MEIQISLKKIITILFSVTLLISTGVTYADNYKYQIVGKKIVIFGQELKTTIPINISSPNNENDTNVSFSSSPDQQYVVIEVDTSDQSEFFLYSNNTKSIISLVFEHLPNTIIEWVNNSQFSASWGGMDYSTTRLFDVNKPNVSQVFDNLLYFFNNTKYYVSHVDGGVKVGCTLPCGVKPETFVVKNASGEPISSWVFIDKVYKEGSSIKVLVRQRDGKKILRTFNPKILNKK